MLPEELSKILASHDLWLRSGPEEGERANLEDADLRGLHLSGGLQRARLARADLRTTFLAGTEFFYAILTEANLYGVEIEHANFLGANLQRADLQNAILEKSDFDHANLADAKLQGARLTEAKFEDAKLGGADLRNTTLNRAQFKNADLTASNLQRAQLGEANFECAKLLEADCQNALLNDAHFKNADLTGTNLRGSELRRASLNGATLRRTNLQDTDLQNANLENVDFLLTAQLAGANVAGAKLPAAIAEFKGLETIAEATSNAQKLFVAMLGGSLYSWLTIGTSKDVALLTNSASSPLPIIGTALPIVGFYAVAPIVLLAMYFYFHLNMQRLWEALADLPAVFPDGRSLDKKADPWLLNGLVSAHFVRLRCERPSLSHVQQWLSILLAWWVVPVTLFVFWGRFLVRHDWSVTDLHIVLLTIAVGFGTMSYRLARSTLRGSRRKRFVWAYVWVDFRTYKRIGGTLMTCLAAVVMYLVSVGAINGIPFDEKGTNVSAYNLRILVPRGLKMIGLTPFANLVEEDVSTKSPDWTGEANQYSLVKGAHLREAKLEYSNARRAFFANADLRLAQLSNAHLEDADFWSANLEHADLRNAQLSHANFLNAKLLGVDLSNADLELTSFYQADLSQARVVAARIVGGNLSKTNLYRADLRFSNLEMASLVEADLRWADLSNADLSWADLLQAKLFKTNLSGANLEGTDFSGANLKDVTGLTRSQIEVARTNEKTVLPANLPP